MAKKVFLLVFILLCGAAMAEERISSVDFDDAAVLDVIRILARQADLDLVISGENGPLQNKRTSLHLKDVTAEEAVYYVLDANGLFYEKKDSALLVALSPQAQNPAVPDGETEAVELKYLSAEKAAILLSKVFPALKSAEGERPASLVLHGKTALVAEAKKLLSAIDKPAPQILIESKVLEISSADSTRLGFSFGSGAGGFKFITGKDSGQTVLADDVQTTLNALIGSGKANVVASPKIATLDSHEAVINIGSRIPYAVPVSSGSGTQWSVEYIEAGVRLAVTPRLGENGNITTLIQPEVSSVSEWRTTAAGDFPVITTRNARAMLRVQDGETIVIGGLLSETDRENVSKLPVLGYIPLAGMLFQNKTIEKAKTEIIFLITPHII